MAPRRASHTGLAVARSTTLAHTQNREWSSMPVTTEGASRRPGGRPRSRPSARAPSTGSAPNACSRSRRRLLALGVDELVADKAPIDGRARRQRLDAGPGQAVQDGPRSPAAGAARRISTILASISRRHLMRDRCPGGALVDQSGQALDGIAAQPGVDGLAAHPIAPGDIGHGSPVIRAPRAPPYTAVPRAPAPPARRPPPSSRT